MKKFAAAVVLGAVFACGPQSELGPDDEVTVRGSAFRQSGAVLSNTRVALVKEPDLGEVLTGFTAIIGTIGTACLIEDPPPLCDSARTTTTGSTGGYAFSLLGADTQGTVGQASHFNLSVRGPARPGAVAGPARTERFVIQSTLLEPPELVLWEPEVSVATSASGIAVSSEGALPEGATAATVAFGVPGALLWETAFSSGTEVDGRFLEDASGTVSVHTRSSGPEFEHRFESEVHAFQSQTGAPPSRGTACVARGASGAGVAQSPCGLTDGDFATPWAPPEESAETLANKSVTVDLGAVREASLIVIRGAGDNVVERSTDNQTWVEVTLEGSFHRFLLPVDVRYVRIRPEQESGVLVGSLREVSVW